MTANEKSQKKVEKVEKNQKSKKKLKKSKNSLKKIENVEKGQNSRKKSKMFGIQNGSVLKCDFQTGSDYKSKRRWSKRPFHMRSD